MKTYTFHENVTTERKLAEMDYQRRKITLQALFYGLGLFLLGIVGLILFFEEKSFAILFGICMALGAVFPLLPYLVVKASMRQLRQHGAEPMDYCHVLDEEGLHYQYDFLSDKRTLIPYSALKKAELFHDLLFFVPQKREFQYPSVDLSHLEEAEREQLLKDVGSLLAQARQEKREKRQKKHSDFQDS